MYNERRKVYFRCVQIRLINYYNYRVWIGKVKSVEQNK